MMKRLLFILFLFITCPFLSMGQKSCSVSARLEGRTVDKAGLIRPFVTTQESGVIVIQIKVDQYGKVKDASIDRTATTLTDKTICDSAIDAALNTGFSMSPGVEKTQLGTITYRFGDTQYPEASVKDLVDKYCSGAFRITAKYVEIYDSSRLIFLVEDEDYVIPIQLIKNDLGAEKRFQKLNLKKGDVLTIKGTLQRIEINNGKYKGLAEASIVL